jgi:hypothetical protein
VLHEGGIEIAQHDLALEIGTEAEVELLDGGSEGEAGLAQAAGRGRGGAGRQLLLEQALQEVGVAQVLLGGALQPRGQDGGRPTEVDLGEQGGKVQRS